MLYYSFSDIVYSSFFFITLILICILYYVHSNTITTPFVLSTDKKTKKIDSVSIEIKKIIFIVNFIIMFFINFIYIFKNFSQLLFWQNLVISNNTQYYFLLLLIVFLFIIIICLNIDSKSMTLRIEYILSLLVLLMFAKILNCSNTLLLTIFVIDSISLLIFSKFIFSNRILKSSNMVKRKETLTFIKKYSFGFFNAIFFQFWVNFVSTAILLFCIINIHYLFGLSQYFLINFFYTSAHITQIYPDVYGIFILSLLVVGFLIKLGVAPYQFFKIETYKGLSLLVVIIYTVLYLLIYLYLFMYLLVINLSIIKQFTNFILIFSLIISVVYTINILFDTTNFKAFLSFSTLINTINVLIPIICL